MLRSSLVLVSAAVGSALPTGYECIDTTVGCAENYYESAAGVCSMCTAGVIAAAVFADPFDTVDPCTCAENHYVSSNVCTACATTDGVYSTRPAGDDPSGVDTTCTANVGCAANFFEDGTGSDTCTACPAGTELASAAFGGAATVCTAITCAENHYVSSNVCTACATTDGVYSTRAAGDDASAGDTTCTPNVGCAANFFEDGTGSDTCTACAAGKELASAAFGGAATVCTAITCEENHYVSTSNVCTPCATTAGVYSTRAAGDDASGGDTTCTADVGCAEDFYEAGTGSDTCTACPSGKTLASAAFTGAATECVDLSCSTSSAVNLTPSLLAWAAVVYGLVWL